MAMQIFHTIIPGSTTGLVITDNSTLDLGVFPVDAGGVSGIGLDPAGTNIIYLTGTTTSDAIVTVPMKIPLKKGQILYASGGFHVVVALSA